MNDSDISLTNIGHGHEQGLALSPNTSKQQVALAACSNDPALRIAAAYHPALASNLRQQLAQDTDPARPRCSKELPARNR